MPHKMDRREALLRGLGATGVLAGGGLPALLAPNQAPAAPKLPDRSNNAPTAPVAIQRCQSFEPKLFRRKLDTALDLIGGIDDLVRGKTVTIKLNLTGLEWKPCAGLPPYETYQTHPNTVAALCAILHDAGARHMVIVENLYWRDPFEKTLSDAGWDVAGIKSAGGHQVVFEDTRNRGHWPQYSRFKVPWGGFIYPAFDLNQRYEKTDVLISMAKLKQHACAGVTMAIKNFFGITPCSLYGNDAPNEDSLIHRTSMFHSGRKQPPEGVPQEVAHEVPGEARYRVPRVVADIYGARPADLAVIDGIRTIRGGEGHWNRGVAPIEPKLLLVGRNGVCTDAVCTAAMGFDPQAPRDQYPFQGDNHLQLLASQGIGTNNLDRIEIVGLPLKEAVHPYGPQPAAKG
ncbi:hypothetical protein AMJ85_04785 [candidate division BRC1 bacterium SM23_51]|nr:MAG: hypothetical protein AMJ85_04785 [candidate division BRC1 bacterium SM23_51]